MFVMYTPWETLENLWFTLPHFPPSLDQAVLSLIVQRVIRKKVLYLTVFYKK